MNGIRTVLDLQQWTHWTIIHEWTILWELHETAAH